MEGRKWYRRTPKRVDIALLSGGDPAVFIEVKRLNRDYDPDYMDQLKDYASNMDSGTAVLTNGRYWLISTVTDGVSQHRLTVDVMEGSAESVAKTLNGAIGRTAIAADARRGPPAAQLVRPLTSEQITDALKDYRGREAQQRRRLAFTIFSDATIALIAERKPANTAELQSIKGVGPTILRQHGEAILKIVAGRME